MALLVVKRTNALFQRKKASVNLSALHASLHVVVGRVLTSLGTREVDERDAANHLVAAKVAFVNEATALRLAPTCNRRSSATI